MCYAMLSVCTTVASELNLILVEMSMIYTAPYFTDLSTLHCMYTTTIKIYTCIKHQLQMYSKYSYKKSFRKVLLQIH